MMSCLFAYRTWLRDARKYPGTGLNAQRIFGYLISGIILSSVKRIAAQHIFNIV